MPDTLLYVLIGLLLLSLAGEFYWHVIRRAKPVYELPDEHDRILQAEVSIMELEALERVGYERGWSDHARKHDCACETARAWTS